MFFWFRANDKINKLHQKLRVASLSLESAACSRASARRRSVPEWARSVAGSAFGSLQLGCSCIGGGGLDRSVRAGVPWFIHNRYNLGLKTPHSRRLGHCGDTNAGVG